MTPIENQDDMTFLKPHLRAVVTEDGAVILDMQRDVMISLNAMGSYIWNKLAAGKFIDEIAADLARETGAELAIVERDVHDFIDSLNARHLLKKSSAFHQSGSC